MLEYIKILIILMILFLVAGCSIHTFASISDCERIKADSQKDKCFASLIDGVPLKDVDLRIKTCGKIIDVEMNDLCFFKVAHESWKFTPPSDLDVLCDNINDSFLKQSCKDINGRPHLQMIR